MENNTFKGSMFGGFNRRDVLEYIEKTSKESSDALLQANADIEDLRSKLSAAEAELTTLRDENNTLITARDNLQSKLFDANAETEALRCEYDAKMKELNSSAEKIRSLEGEVARLAPEVDDYHAMKTEIADIELQAKKRAAAITEEANANAALIRQRAEASAMVTRQQVMALLASFDEQYDKIYTDFEITSAHLNGELTKLQSACGHLPEIFTKLSNSISSLKDNISKKD